MSARGTVKWISAKNGVIVIAVEDGTHVLAEPLGAETLHMGAQVTGNMHSVGEVTLKQVNSKLLWRGFILAYDLSESAVLTEIA